MLGYCFLSDGFSKIAKISNAEQKLRKTLDLKFPIHFWTSNYNSSETKYKFICTPICLSGPRSFEELHMEISKFNKIDHFGGAYIQTRAKLTSINDIQETYNDKIVSYRTVYYLLHTWSMDDWYSRMKRDSRSRFKKLAEYCDVSHITIERVSFGESIDGELATQLSSKYHLTASERNFSSSYRFSAEQFLSLLNDPSWALIVVHANNDVIGFCIIGETEVDWDYTFAVSRPFHFDVSRLLIKKAFEFAKENNKNLCLGGGISENDQLSDFKSRMGTEAVRLANFKIISDKLLSFIGHSRFISYKTRRWPDA